MNYYIIFFVTLFIALFFSVLFIKWNKRAALLYLLNTFIGLIFIFYTLYYNAFENISFVLLPLLILGIYLNIVKIIKIVR
ncbi:hypothetical protein C7R94_06585 [Brevibacillus sp. NRRL NRS-603]|nr:hypothetical protein [Brevibacillus formosus]PSK19774.1 hypothetical protein C7R94_06585 [Brevibacillus sp. NRRL NRS-603]